MHLHYSWYQLVEHKDDLKTLFIKYSPQIFSTIISAEKDNSYQYSRLEYWIGYSFKKGGGSDEVSYEYRLDNNYMD